MESLGSPPPMAISNVPEVKMVSTSKVSSSAFPSVASVVSVVASVVASVEMSVEPVVVDASVVGHLSDLLLMRRFELNRLNQYR